MMTALLYEYEKFMFPLTNCPVFVAMETHSDSCLN
jgi:hypothetical protein